MLKYRNIEFLNRSIWIFLTALLPALRKFMIAKAIENITNFLLKMHFIFSWFLQNAIQDHS